VRGRLLESIYGLRVLNIRCLPIGSFTRVFHFDLILPQLLDNQVKIVSSIMWLQTQPEFIMALLGGSWRLISMAGWCNYIYCSKCDRPYHNWEIERCIPLAEMVSNIPLRIASIAVKLWVWKVPQNIYVLPHSWRSVYRCLSFRQPYRQTINKVWTVFT